MFAQVATAEMASALVKFYSKDDVAKYIRSIIENYQKQVEQHGDKLGALLRTSPQGLKPEREEKEKKAEKNLEGKKVAAKGWVRTGSMLFNVSDPIGGTAEVLFQLHEEAKQKLARATESLKSFEEAAGSIIPEGATYTLHLRNGTPERLIVDTREKRRDTFSYAARFRVTQAV